MALQDHMRYMMVQGRPLGYFPKPTKRILFVSPRNVQRAEEYFRGMGFRMVTRRRYIGGFIVDPVLDKAWMYEKLKGWTGLVEVLSRVELQHPQT